jgi:hypothetical protein
MTSSSTLLNASKKNKDNRKTINSNDISEESSTSKDSSHGKNWNEEDSLLLLETYLHIEGKKRYIYIFKWN